MELVKGSRFHLSPLYKEVGHKTFEKCDFDEIDLQRSIDLFEVESVKNRRPVPRKLKVWCLVSGVSFDINTIKSIEESLSPIKELLKSNNIYWVDKNNYGVEYLIYKWPEDPDPNEIQKKMMYKSVLNNKLKGFSLNVSGLQVNPDGCFILKGYDETGSAFAYREKIKMTTKLPEKQSNWLHIPVGRLLEKIGKEKFTIVNVSPQILKVFKIAGFDNIFTIK